MSHKNFTKNKSKLQSIFLDNNNWNTFKKSHQDQLDDDTIEIVEKSLLCGLNGGFTYACNICGNVKYCAFGCNSKFCTHCGKRMIDIWSEKVSRSILKVDHRHWILTLDSNLWPIIDKHRHLLDVLFRTGYEFIKKMMSMSIKIHKKTIVPGVIMTLHTSGRSLDFKPHIHCIVTEGSLILNNKNPKKASSYQWRRLKSINFNSLRMLWMNLVLNQFKSVLPGNYSGLLDNIREKQNKGFVINAPKKNIVSNAKYISRYISRYIRHPPIAESRIDGYDGNCIHYHYIDTRTKIRIDKVLSVHGFMLQLLKHIQKKGFRMIRYYGIYVNKYKNIYLSIFMELRLFISTSLPTRRPILCTKCNNIMSIILYHSCGPPCMG